MALEKHTPSDLVPEPQIWMWPEVGEKQGIQGLGSPVSCLAGTAAAGSAGRRPVCYRLDMLQPPASQSHQQEDGWLASLPSPPAFWAGISSASTLSLSLSLHALHSGSNGLPGCHHWVRHSSPRLPQHLEFPSHHGAWPSAPSLPRRWSVFPQSVRSERADTCSPLDPQHPPVQCPAHSRGLLDVC